jgi:hypothetical protein
MFKNTDDISPIEQEKSKTEADAGEWIKQALLKSLIGSKSPVKIEITETQEDAVAQMSQIADLETIQKYCDSLNQTQACSIDGEATFSLKDENDEMNFNYASKEFADAIVEQAFKNDNKRDVNVIQALTEARQKIDSALIFMKFNLIHDASQSSILTTPQTMVKNQIGIKRSTSQLQSSSRRRTVGTPTSPGKFFLCYSVVLHPS